MNALKKTGLTITLALAALFTQAHAAEAKGDLAGKNVVLVHGAFADGSSWQKVIPLLEKRGLHVVAVQNPLSSLGDDVAATRRAIEKLDGPVILVGHSWGGVVISQAGNDDKVKGLVYVAAFAPDSGQSIADMLKDKPAPAWASVLQKDSGGFVTLPTATVLQDFAQDLPPEEARVVAATQGPWAGSAIADKVTTAAWHNKPSWYIVADQDHMIDPRFEAAMGKQIGAQVTHVNTSHVAMLKQPAAVANVIIAAASKIN
jgi:pimeloyl-ACP methyl ester carboxylesterase